MKRPRWLTGRPRAKGEGTRRLRGQSAATQTAPQFEPRLRPRGHPDENASGRWEHFFPSPIKIGTIWMGGVRLRWAVGDALSYAKY
jgi:hypothetical protein